MSVVNEYLLKICAIGSGNVGKTSLIRKFAENKFDTNYLPTLGVDITTKRIVVNNNPIKLILVDTAGQEFFGKLRPSYYRGASACSIFYNRSDRRSFEEVPKWLSEFHNYVTSKVPLALIGITSHSEVVSSEEGLQLAKELNGSYFECLTSNGPQIERIFEFLAKKAIDKPKKPGIDDSRSFRFKQYEQDLQIVKTLLQAEYYCTGSFIFTRDEVLDLWVQYERHQGNQTPYLHLRNRLLRSRLSSIFEMLQQVSDSHLSVILRRSRRGRSKALLVLNKIASFSLKN